MKYILFFIFILSPFSTLAEMYSCKYNELSNTKIITFDRITHSHFKKCSIESCDKNRYEVIYADENNLIFGNIILKEQKESNAFQLILIDKQSNSFTAAKIGLPQSNINNKFVKGKCTLN